MSRTVIKERIALVAGADNPVGRACALQLSRAGARVILVGDQADALSKLCDLIMKKKGDPADFPLPRGVDDMVPVLRTLRDSVGHFHFVVNALAFGGDTARALQLQRDLAAIEAERGFGRFMMIWPDAVERPERAGVIWESLVRVGTLADPGDDASPHLRPAAIADAAVCLLQCPPSACPIDVLLDARSTKAGA